MPCKVKTALDVSMPKRLYWVTDGSGLGCSQLQFWHAMPWGRPPQHGSRKRHSDLVSFRRLCDTDGLRASKLQHAIQRTDCDANLSRSARIRARPQCVPDYPFVSADIGLNQRTPVVAGRFLPGHSAAFGYEL